MSRGALATRVGRCCTGQTLVRSAQGLPLSPFPGGRLPARTPLSPASEFSFPEFCVHRSVGCPVNHFVLKHGTSLEIPWLRLQGSDAEDMGSMPGGELGSHMHRATKPARRQQRGQHAAARAAQPCSPLKSKEIKHVFLI